MALLESQPLLSGNKGVEFCLNSVSGNELESESYFGNRIRVLMFICAHCPYVLAIEDRMLQLAHSYAHIDEIRFLVICSNDFTEHSEDSPSELKARTERLNYPFPYLVDEDQSLARALDVQCTPEFYVYDSLNQMAYHGRLDDNWKDANSVSNHELKEAIDALLNGKQPNALQYPSIGCSIKWKSNK